MFYSLSSLIRNVVAASTIGAAVVVPFSLSGCSLPHAGPSYGSITDQSKQVSPVSLVRVDDQITDILNSDKKDTSFFDAFGNNKPDVYKVTYGDSIELYIWESAPALLFGTGSIDSVNVGVSSQKLPTQIIEEDGKISVPFVGMISVVGKTVRQIENDILKALESKANNPQVLVMVSNRPADKVTIIGDVKGGSNVLLTPKGEKILDAIAASSGVANSFNKITLSLTRDGKTVEMPLESVIKDPKQNIYLNPGDVLIAMYQPWSFSVLGANNGAAKEINFEATGINLVQAMARIGGLNDNMANPEGVFIFRFEDKKTYQKLSDNLSVPYDEKNKGRNPQGSVVYPLDMMDKYSKLETIPVVYQVDFSQPGAFFSSQNFSIKNGDVIYVATASSYELSKFLRIIGLIVNPALSWGNTINKMTD